MEKEKSLLVSDEGYPSQDESGGVIFSGSRINRNDYSKFRINSQISKVEATQAQKTVATTQNNPASTKEEAVRSTSVNIDMNLPGGNSPKPHAFVVKNPFREKLAGWTFKLASIVIILVIAFGGVSLTLSYININRALRGGAKTAAAMEVGVDPSLLNSEGDGRVNILLMGRGGGNHDGPDLTDSMMLASIDPVDKNMVLVSIPRDLWIDVPGHGAMKINAAWETGEFVQEGNNTTGSTDPKVISSANQEADQVVESVLGVNINYNMVVNFKAFSQAVDAVGGVALNVPSQLYDPTMAWENKNNPVLAQSGIQNFDGAKALLYVRSRETTSDFARAQRQRSMLVAIKSKAESLGVVSNPVKLSKLANSFGNNIASDISISDATKLYKIISGISEANIKSVGLADNGNTLIKTAKLNGQSVVLPAEGMFKYDNIHNLIQSLLPDPYIKKENSKIFVLNSTNDSNLLNNKVNQLKSLGYNIVGTGQTSKSNYTSTILVANTKNMPYTMHYLEQRLNATVLDSLSDQGMTQTKGADFVIIIGNDETINSQN